MRLVGLTMVVTIAVMACAGSRPKQQPTPPAVAPTLTLAVLAVESDKFPDVARAATESLAKVKVAGIDKVEISKVSLEVVQLSIECVEPTVACYEAVCRSLSANRLLFAQVEPGAPAKPLKGKVRKAPKRDVRVSVTLFDAATGTPKTAEKIFPTEHDATAGLDTLVAEAVQ